jgi:RNA polymerase sigma-70 factor (ECF subfamily)
MGMEAAAASVEFERFRPQLLLLARGRLSRDLHGPLDPSGLVQEVFLKAWQARRSLRAADDRALQAWLRRILVRQIYNAVRDSRRQKRGGERVVSLETIPAETAGRIPSPGPTPSEVFQARELKDLVAASLAELAPDERTALVLRYWHRRSTAEIADRLGQREGAVTLLIHRGLARLKRLLWSRI